MITNTGKNILAKYLIGQSPAYASYMAFGAGPKPKDSLDSFTTQEYAQFAQKEILDFELFRTPITSRGYVTENINGQDVSKVVLTAELPPDQRYQITEVGIFSARANPSASGRDSRMLYTFTEAENWQYHDETTSSSLGTVVTEPLYLDSDESGSSGGDIIDPNIRSTPAFMVSADNVLFTSDTRISRYEGGRYLNTMVMVPGNMSQLELDGTTMRVKPKDTEYHGSHIHYLGVNLNLQKNSSEDLIKTAFSVINKDGSSTKEPTKIYIMIEFSSTDSARPTNYARMPIIVTSNEFSSSRYVVDTQPLSNMETSENFSWSDVSVIKIYATVFENNLQNQEVVSDNFYIGFDAIRLENITSANPLYGMTGYSVLQSDNAATLLKEPNSSNLVEFRFGLDVQ
jgi:hypothetical protein